MNVMQYNIYAFSGKIGVGKDYLAHRFIQLNNITNYSYICFADAFKIDVVVRDNIPYEHVFHAKTAESRKMLQKRGTEEGRDKYGEDIWIKYVQTRIQLDISRGIRNFIITDARFKNELSWLKFVGAHIYRIIAKQRNWDKLMIEGKTNDNALILSQHISETDLDSEQFEYYIYNDYSDEKLTVDNMLKL